MLKTLPFNALRTLEAVVRLRGFQRAADELNVTQSAVSQHIRQLEDWLGEQLVVRQSPQIAPTDHGAQLAVAVRDGFGAIEAICDRLRNRRTPARRGLLLGAPPGFAFLWLLPRLLRFDDQHPDMPVSLSTDPKSLDPGSSDADALIAYSAGGFPDMHAEKLMSETMAPVCAPALAAQITDVSGLGQQVILHDMLSVADHTSTWDFWAREVNLPLPHLPKVRKYGQANLVIQAAINGAGVAMGRGPLVADAIAQGTLVYPFADKATSQLSYWFVCRHEALKSPSVQAFRAWIHAEASAPPLITPHAPPQA